MQMFPQMLPDAPRAPTNLDASADQGKEKVFCALTAQPAAVREESMMPKSYSIDQIGRTGRILT